MKKYYFLLLALAGCGQSTTERQATNAAAAKASVVREKIPQAATLAKTTIAYTSGDRATAGPLDTLHVGNSLVLHLKPGSKSDFVVESSTPALYSEARTIRKKGDGQVYRIGHTLVVRPFNSPELRFSDDTYQMRKDENEEIDTHCQFSGSISGRPYWIVDSLQWERYQPFLINKYSGQTTPIPSIPEISPDKRFLFIGICGLDIESDFNGLALWSISDLSVTPLWTRMLQKWQPQQVRWLDKHTIAIEQLRFEPHEHKTYVRLVLPN